jgi:hypothetical protein
MASVKEGNVTTLQTIGGWSREMVSNYVPNLSGVNQLIICYAYYEPSFAGPEGDCTLCYTFEILLSKELSMWVVLTICTSERLNMSVVIMPRIWKVCISGLWKMEVYLYENEEWYTKHLTSF